MLHEFIKSFLLIFIAEMGDKTQILLMTCGARYSVLQVLIGIFFGVLLNHGLAIIIGSYISTIISLDILQVFAGLIFIIFGLFTLKIDNNNEDRKRNSRCGPILTVAIAFFIGELGDKTQLTAMTIAIESNYPFIVLAGSISGIIVIGCMAIIIGNALTKQIPSYIIKLLSGIIFICFGCIKLFATSNIFIQNTLYQSVLIVFLSLSVLYLMGKLIMNR